MSETKEFYIAKYCKVDGLSESLERVLDMYCEFTGITRELLIGPDWNKALTDIVTQAVSEVTSEEEAKDLYDMVTDPKWVSFMEKQEAIEKIVQQKVELLIDNPSVSELQ